MALHAKYKVRHLHIGCDEVYHVGQCNLCQTKSRNELLLGHMARVAGEFIQTYGALGDFLL